MFLGCHTLRFLSLEGFTKGASKLTQDTEHPCSGAGLEALRTAQDGSGRLRRWVSVECARQADQDDGREAERDSEGKTGPAWPPGGRASAWHLSTQICGGLSRGRTGTPLSQGSPCSREWENIREVTGHLLTSAITCGKREA